MPRPTLIRASEWTSKQRRWRQRILIELNNKEISIDEFNRFSLKYTFKTLRIIAASSVIDVFPRLIKFLARNKPGINFRKVLLTGRFLNLPASLFQRPFPKSKSRKCVTDTFRALRFRCRRDGRAKRIDFLAGFRLIKRCRSGSLRFGKATGTGSAMRTSWVRPQRACAEVRPTARYRKLFWNTRWICEHQFSPRRICQNIPHVLGRTPRFYIAGACRSIPSKNGLTRFSHPCYCQTMSSLWPCLGLLQTLSGQNHPKQVST